MRIELPDYITNGEIEMLYQDIKAAKSSDPIIREGVIRAYDRTIGPLFIAALLLCEFRRSSEREIPGSPEFRRHFVPFVRWTDHELSPLSRPTLNGFSSLPLSPSCTLALPPTPALVPIVAGILMPNYHLGKTHNVVDQTTVAGTKTLASQENLDPTLDPEQIQRKRDSTSNFKAYGSISDSSSDATMADARNEEAVADEEEGTISHQPRRKS